MEDPKRTLAIRYSASQPIPKDFQKISGLLTADRIQSFEAGYEAAMVYFTELTPSEDI